MRPVGLSPTGQPPPAPEEDPALDPVTIPLPSTEAAFRSSPEQPVCAETHGSDPAESVQPQSEAGKLLTSPSSTSMAGAVSDHDAPPHGGSSTSLATPDGATQPPLPEHRTGAEHADPRPWWTLPQLRYLLDVVLRTAEVTRSHALKVVIWIQTRNAYAAECHRRRRQRAGAQRRPPT
jgi:hypothetical protein